MLLRDSPELGRRWLRTPQAADAIGVPAKTLNTWIERGALDPFRLSGSQQWKRFSLAALAALSLAPALLAVGAPLRQTVAWSHGLFPEIDLGRRETTEAGAAFLVRVSKDWLLAIWPDGDKLKHDFIGVDGTGAPPVAGFWVIRAGQLLAECFARALALRERPSKGRPPSPPRS